jgi:hypothetical protein
MFKNFKNKIAFVGSSLIISANSLIAGDLGIASDGGEPMLVKILALPLVSMTIKTGILFGMLYAIFLIAKELVAGDQGGKGGMWSKLGAIVSFAVLYYFLYGGGLS